MRNPYRELAREWREATARRRRASTTVNDRNGSIDMSAGSQGNIMEMLTSFDNGE